jgi:hypothetical protein
VSTAHANLSPSKRHRWALCPGSVREEAAYPDERNAAAIDGTHSHTLLEHRIKASAVDPLPMVGIKMKDHDGEFVVDAERAARVAVAIQYIGGRMGECLGTAKVIAEQRVDPQWLLSRGDLAGTVDVQIHDPLNEVLEIIDYKDGMNDAWDSAILQMEQYAVGALAALRIAKPNPYPFKTVRMTVIQPKLTLRGGQAVRSVDYPVEKVVDEVARTIVIEAAATDRPDAPLVPGEKQCKYCRAKGGCAALSTKALEVVDTVDITVSAAEKDPTKMTDEQIVQIMEAAPLLRQMLEGVEKEAQTRLERGVDIPGLKMVNGKGHRAWRLSDEEMAEKLKKMGVPKDALYKTTLVSVAQAEKLRWKKRDGTDVQLSKRQLKTLETEYVVKTMGKPVVALAADSRTAITTNAAPLFSAVQSEVPVELPAWLS